MELCRRETGEHYPLTHGLVLGRLDSCGLRIEDSSISRQHARVEMVENVFTLVDLDSSNGIFQNGVRKKRIPLHAGDLITLGSVAFDVIEEQPNSSLASSVAASTSSASSSVRSSEASGRFLARAQLRREIAGDGRSRGLGDLGQQALGVQLLAGLLGLAVLYAVVAGIRFLAQWL